MTARYYDPPELSAGRKIARAVLVAIASDTGRCWHLFGRDGVADAVAGRAPLNSHGHLDGRTRAGKAWLRAQIDVARVVCSLHLDDGLLAEEPCDAGGDHPPFRMMLTDQGRAWLAAEALAS